MIKKIFEKLNNENSNINKSIPLFIIFLFIILNITIIFNLYSKENEKKDLLRLHVVANSNSLDDQITKLKVYENIEKYLNNTVTSNVSNTSDIKEIISNDFENILEISNNTLKENKKNYSSTMEVGKIYYDEKQSVLLDMNEGTYNSVKIVLGNGEGKNIWTLISPSKENLEKIEDLNTILPGINKIYLDDEELENNKNFEYDFKIIDIIQSLKENFTL